MKVSFKDAADLNKAISPMLTYVGPASSGLPILRAVHLAASDGELRVSVMRSGLEDMLTKRIPCTVLEPGECYLDKGVVKPAIDRLKGETTLDLDEDMLHVTVGNKVSKLRTMPSEFLPNTAFSMPTEFDVKATALVTNEWLQDALRIASCASDDDSRPHLTGVKFDREGDQLRLVATDSYRLAYVDAEHIGDGEIPTEGYLISSQSFGLFVKRVAKGEKAHIEFAEVVGHLWVRITAGDLTYLVRCIEGQFPNYRQLIPAHVAQTLTADRAELVETTTWLNAQPRHDGCPVRIVRDDEQHKMQLIVQDVGMWEGAIESAELSASPDFGGSTDFPMRAFNGKYFLAGLEMFDDAKVHIEFSQADNRHPAMLRSGDESDSVRYLLMPCRI